jgi:hypothetical protein
MLWAANSTAVQASVAARCISKELAYSNTLVMTLLREPTQTYVSLAGVS